MSSRSWAGGSTTAWRKLRLVVLARDRYRCRLALPGEWKNKRGQKARCLGTANSVHHTRGRAVTGDDPQYCIAACMPCNLRVGNPAHYNPPHRTVTRW